MVRVDPVAPVAQVVRGDPWDRDQEDKGIGASAYIEMVRLEA